MRVSPYKLKRKEPRLPLRRVNGSLELVDFEWENVVYVQLNTKSGWWGNYVDNSRVGSVYADNADDPILADGAFLARRSAESIAALNVLKTERIASKIESEVTNPYGDRTEAEITITTDGESDDEVVLVVPDYRKTDPSVGRAEAVINDPFGVSTAEINTPTTGEDVVINTPEV